MGDGHLVAAGDSGKALGFVGMRPAFVKAAQCGTDILDIRCAVVAEGDICVSDFTHPVLYVEARIAAEDLHFQRVRR